VTNLRKKSLAVLLGLAAALDCASACAHEFWVEPATFTLESGGRLGIRLCVGDGFEGWSLARNAQRIEKFVAAGPAGEQPIVGLDGSEPAGIARLTTPGGYVIAYRSNRAFTEMPRLKFDEYLKDKGLDRIVGLRAKQGANRQQVVHEAYSRNSKALIRVGNASAIVDRRMGLRLELIAVPDRSQAEGGELHSYQLLFEGRPLAGALVAATRPGTSDEDLKARTDAEGRARFRLPMPGMWRIAVVHMIRAPADVAADWESLWASLTFEIPAGSAGFLPGAGAGSEAACRNKILPSATQARS
jgi:uncharacterized GH25 family protein